MKGIIRKAGILLALLFVTVAIAAAIQDPALAPTPAPTAPVGWEQIAAILLTGIFGIPVQGITQIIKEALRKILNVPEAKWVGWLASAIAVVPAAFLYLKPLGQFSIENLMVASVIGWLVANGLYKKENAIQKNAAAGAIENLLKIPPVK